MVKIMEESISLQELLQILKKRFVIIIILAVIGTTTSGVFAHFFVTPIYQTSTQLVVSRASNEPIVTGSEITVINHMMNTFNDILLSPAILNQVIEALNLEESASSLRGRMEARNAANSLVITLTVQHETPALASDIANKTAEIFSYDLPELFGFDNVGILATAEIPRNPISPRLMMNVGLGFVVGVISGLFLAFLLEFLDKTVKTEQEVQKLIDIPVLGMIPITTTKDIIVKR